MMAGYVLLFQYTDQGIRSVVDTIKRAAAAKEMAGKFGIRIIEFLWTRGQYDGVILAEAPSDWKERQITSPTGTQWLFESCDIPVQLELDDLGRVIKVKPWHHI